MRQALAVLGSYLSIPYRAINAALEKISILIALRRSSDATSQGELRHITGSIVIERVAARISSCCAR